MKSSTKDKAEGTLDQVKGKSKESAGDQKDSQKLDVEGVDEKSAGKVQEKESFK